MDDWKERLLAERAELAERLKKLEAFLQEVLSNEQKRLNFDGWQLELLKMQYGHMRAYLQILDLRIKAIYEAS